MSKKQNSLMRFSRTERLAQLSEQEIVIERKKREIQAKIEAQKKKQTEEALKKLESSKEAKKPGFTKKSGNGTEHEKSNDKEKPERSDEEKTIEQVNESRINAFSNDGSFLDQFKKLSQSGLSAKAVHVQTFTKSQAEESYKKNRSLHDKDVSKETREKGGSTTERDNQPGNENSQSFLNKNSLDSRIQCNVPPSNVANMINQQQSALVLNSTVNNPAKTVSLHSAYVPQFQGGVKNPVHAFNSKISQLNSSQSNFPCSLQSVPAVQYPQLGVVSNTSKQDDSVPSEEGNHFPTNLLASIKPPCTIGPQNVPPPFPIQVQNIPPPPVPPKELPKLRSESISLTLKGNTVKKLEAIPNPLAIDQPPSPPSPKRNPLGFTGTKESSKESFFNATTVVENVSSHDRESSRISSAFYNNDEDGKDSGELLDEKSHHWAELVARYGDIFEDSLRNRIQNDAKTRFLLDKNSKEYMTFRKLVLMYQKRLNSSEEEPIGKTRKLNRPSYDGSTEEIISHSNAVKYSETKSSEEEDFDSKECLGSERMASVDRQENQTHSKYYESRENYLPKKKISELTSEDCLLPSQKQLFPREKSGANSKEGKYELISEQSKNEERPRRKRKSRWGDAIPTTSTPGVATNISLQPAGKLPAPKSTLLSQLTRSDPGLIQYAKQTFGSTNLSEEDWKKAEDHYKINLLYQDMVKKRAEVEKLEKQGKFKYEYDSDEDTEGGTWEHKLRQQEMQATQLWAEELTRQAAGKHHIGDFLPPEELERFMEKYNAVKEGREPDLSDYKEYKLKEDNVGYRLLQKMGWNEGQGLGQDGSGITNPVNKATTRHENQGLGIERPDGLEPGDDEYDAYRKRMMLAYRFRPNPLNNPRRPYY